MTARPSPTSGTPPSDKTVGTEIRLAPQGRGRWRWVRWVYLALAVSGAVWPWLANWEFIQAYGAAFDIGMFLRLAGANPAAQSLSRDLAVASSAIILWMVVETRRLGLRGLPWVLLGCATIAFAFGAPLFLYLRERRLDELETQSG